MKMSHQLSGTTVLTDPPLDNGGQGLSFSPTDLVATALGACMMSVMAIHAKKQQTSLEGMACHVEKHMSADLPRRIIRLDVLIMLPRHLSMTQRQELETIANNCPVIHSLHPGVDIKKNYSYEV